MIAADALGAAARAPTQRKASDGRIVPGPRRRLSSVTPIVANWWDLSPEHLGAISSFAGQPRDLCVVETVCTTWLGAMRDAREEERTWHRLCAQWFPTMVARIDADAAGDGKTID